jgi:hypothetical protein
MEKELYKWQWIRTWDDEPLYNCLKDLPVGWVKAFGQQMVDELNAILVKYNLVDEYSIAQVKEKFGGLRWYDNFTTVSAAEEYYTWLQKYEDLSVQTCIVCGEPGTMRHTRWISPYCDICVPTNREEYR